MTQLNTLDVKGTFTANPLAELLIEIDHAKLSGSLRMSNKDQKSILYFDEGNVIFGVSNSKSHRLFNVMLQNKRIEKDVVVKHTNFANDLEFAQSLKKNGTSEDEINSAFSLQIDAIAVDALSWPDGEWHFSPLARLRSDIRFETNVARVLISYARCIPLEIVVNRFRSVQEAFSLIPDNKQTSDLQSHESYLLSVFENAPLTIEQLRTKCSLPEGGLLQALYVLWLGGALHRVDWNSAFSTAKVNEILNARIVRVKAAENLAVVKDAETPQQVLEEPAAPKAAELTIPLEEYLQRVEGAKTHYDTLGVDNDADIAAIKQMYFGLAKLFHPDKFHRESPTKQKRIQTAFTELSHAYETLKSTVAREEYNFKMRKEMEEREKRLAAGIAEDEVKDVRGETALQSFEQALVLLNDEEYDQASVLLGRAVHYSPENAQFHAYYGQALSYLGGNEHKAEGEFQRAIKLDPKNPKIRMMLIDFFIDMNQTKRAVGELNRFLELVPGNKDALQRLQKLARAS